MNSKMRKWLSCAASEFGLSLVAALTYVFLLDIADNYLALFAYSTSFLFCLLRSSLHFAGLTYFNKYLHESIELAASAEESTIQSRFKIHNQVPDYYSRLLAVALGIHFPAVLLFCVLFQGLVVDEARVTITLAMSSATCFAMLAIRGDILVSTFKAEIEKFCQIAIDRQVVFTFPVDNIGKRTRSYLLHCLLCLASLFLVLILCLLQAQNQESSRLSLDRSAKLIEELVKELQAQDQQAFVSIISKFLPKDESGICFDRSGQEIGRFGSQSEIFSTPAGQQLLDQISISIRNDKATNSFDRAFGGAVKTFRSQNIDVILCSKAKSPFRSSWLALLLLSSTALIAFLVLSSKYFSSRITSPIEKLQSSCISLFTSGSIRKRPLVTITETSELGHLTQAYNAVLLRLKSLVNIADAVAVGELSVPVEGSGDLHRAFKTMIDNLSRAVDEISGESDDLVSRGIAFVEASTSQEKIANDQSKLLSQVSELVTQFDDNTSQMRSSVTEIVASAELSLETVDDLTESINDFSFSIESIKQILSAIRRISHQSRMLALNIEIETSRLDEKSLGLNAIASEARRLNEEIDSSIRVVRDLIDSMYKSLAATEKSVTGNRSFVQMTLKLTRDFDDYTANQSQAGRRLVRRLKKAAKTVKSGALRAEEVKQEASELQVQATRLRQSIKRIKNPEMVTNSDNSDHSEAVLDRLSSAQQYDSDILNQALLRSHEVLLPDEVD